MEDVLDAGLFGFSKKGMAFYRDFHRLEDVEAFAALLREHDIPYAFEEIQQLVDANFTGSGLLPRFVLNAFPRDFERINTLVNEQVATLSAAELEAHFLAGYDDKELLDFLKSTEDKTAEERAIAHRLLELRGTSVSPEEIERLRIESLNKIRGGKQGSQIAMALYALGGIVGLFVSYLFFIAGLGMAYYYAYGKQTDYTGFRHYIFDQRTRHIGQLLFFGLLTVFLIALIAFVYLEISLFNSLGNYDWMGM